MKKIIVLSMIFCLILTSCRINPKETKQSENNVLEYKQTEALGDYQWITSHCTYRTDIDEEDDYEEILIQCDYQGKVLQKIPADKFGVEDSSELSVINVSEGELLFTYEYGERDVYHTSVYTVPLVWEDGKEKINYSQKRLLFSKASDNSPKYIAGTKAHIILDWDGEMTEYNRQDKKFTKLKYNHKPVYYEASLSSIKSKNYFLFLGKCEDAHKHAAYQYIYGKKEVREIIEDNNCMIYQCGNDKLFFSGVKDGKGAFCYDVIQYDCQSEKKSVLVSEGEIKNNLSEKPEDGLDLLRQMAYEDGILKLEVYDKGKSVVFSVDIQTGKMQREREGRLEKQQEYQLKKTLVNADKKYKNANNHNVFIKKIIDDKGIDDVLDEYTLDGKFVRRIFTHDLYDWSLVYANDKELIFRVYGENKKGYFYTVPLLNVDGNDFPQMAKAKKICPIYEKMSSDMAEIFDLYVDENYLVYNTNYHDIGVYNRKKKKFVNVKGIPLTNMYFIAARKFYIGDKIILESKPYGKAGKEKYAFSYYKIGSDKIHIMDSACYTSAEKICDEKRNQVIYALDTGIWCYNLQKEKKEKLITNKEIASLFGKANNVFEMCVWNDLLYLFTADDKIYSYSLEKKGKVRYEKAFSEKLKQICKEKEEGGLSAWCSEVYMVEGEIYLKIELDSEEDDTVGDIYCCYDPAAKRFKEIKKNDEEMFYCMLD